MRHTVEEPPGRRRGDSGRSGPRSAPVSQTVRYRAAVGPETVTEWIPGNW